MILKLDPVSAENKNNGCSIPAVAIVGIEPKTFALLILYNLANCVIYI